MAINELAFVGYWFYGTADDTERASLFSSYGLIEDAPEPVVSDEKFVKIIGSSFKKLIE